MTAAHIQKLLLLVGISFVSMVGFLLFSNAIIGVGFPLDDAWIHQTYARNLVLLGEWSYVPGKVSAGSTAPLWTLLLAGGHFLRIQPVSWVFFLGLTSLVCLGWIACLYFQKSIHNDRWFTALAIFVLTFEYHLVWASLSGMETLLYAVVITVVLLGPLIWNISPFGIGLIVGISVWMRPDGITLICPYLLFLVLQYRFSKQFFIQASRLLIGLAIIFIPYLLFNYLLAGSLWPSTLFAKQAEYAVLRELTLVRRVINIFTLPLIGVGILLVPGFIWFMVQSGRNRQWLNIGGSLWVLGFMLIYAFRLPVTYQHGRYIMPAMPLFFIYGMVGTHQVLSIVKNQKYRRMVRSGWMLATASVVFVFWLLGANAYARDVAIIETEMVAMSKWIAANTRPEARIAAHDIGALGYFGHRDIYDLAGLITPEVIPVIRVEPALVDLINQSGASYLMTFPDWYELIPKCGSEIHRTEGRFVQDFGQENMVLYQWTDNCIPKP